MKIMITGGCGFVGSNIAEEAMRRGDELLIFDNLYRKGSQANLDWLNSLGNFEHINGDIRNRNDVERAIAEFGPEAIFHLAGQVAMTTSIANPQFDFEINVVGTFNVLESVRKHAPDCLIIYSSTNKVYGDLEQFEYEETETRFKVKGEQQDFSELTPLDFHSPYGCSKGAADQYLLDYHRIFGLKTVVLRHSSMYGGRQHATADQGWVGWFCKRALEISNKVTDNTIKISGSGKQVRDLLYSSDIVDLYYALVKNIDQVKGQAFNIGGGVENSLSLLELFSILEKEMEIKISLNKGDWRESDQKIFIADNSKVTKLTGWKPQVDCLTGIRNTLKWLKG